MVEGEEKVISVIILGSIFYLIKWSLEKTIDNGIKSSFEKSMEIFKNNLYRATRAYEILLGREMRFYEKVDSLIAELIPLEQDLLYYLKNNMIENVDIQREKFMEIFKRYGELIISLKNEILIHQLYVPEEIMSNFIDLVKQMQEDAKIWNEMGRLLIEGKEPDINYQICEKIVDRILLKIAISQNGVYGQLKNLSGEK
ncbi:hypothetical protein [Granulicatella elegans]|uniref:hypothetical protein n=1 Tax=Granulicatella elegans TaxID=137732 RepID=UPI0028D8B40D|nr:hypothetical protein [Granulicatella elegans]